MLTAIIISVGQEGVTFNEIITMCCWSVYFVGLLRVFDTPASNKHIYFQPWNYGAKLSKIWFIFCRTSHSSSWHLCFIFWVVGSILTPKFCYPEVLYLFLNHSKWLSNGRTLKYTTTASFHAISISSYIITVISEFQSCSILLNLPQINDELISLYFHNQNR